MQDCKLCEISKPEDEFYLLDRTCKVCRVRLVREYRQKNIEKIQAYDRKRGGDEKRQAANRRRYQKRISSPEGKAREREKSRVWTQNNQYNGKRAVNLMVSYAIRIGKLTPEKCWWCGSGDHIHAHHEDYSKPLEIMWLCRNCHGRRHRGINEVARLAG